MREPFVATPCLTNRPAIAPSNANTIQRLMSSTDSTTCIITETMKTEFRSARPIKGPNLAQRPRRNVNISIFEDTTAHPKLQTQDEPSRKNRTSMYDRPARRIRIAPTFEEETVETRVRQRSIPPQVGIQNNELAGDPTLGPVFEGIPGDRPESLVRKPRRRTIWVPDDTTVATIHPGVHSHTLRDDTLYFPNRPMKASTGHQDTRPKRGSGASFSAAAERGPLLQVPSTEPNVSLGDIAGSGGGKENRSPFDFIFEEKPKALLSDDVLVLHTSTTQPLKMSPPRSEGQFLKPTVTSRAKQSIVINQLPIRTKSPAASSQSTVSAAHSKASTLYNSKKLSNNQQSPRPAYAQVPSRFVGSLRLGVSRGETSKHKSSSYPVLPDDLHQPELYEESWLSHQEVSLTQLINAISERIQPPNAVDQSIAALRPHFLKIYQRSETVAIHKRISASLQCGALGLPKGTIPARLCGDIGKSRQFLDLWLESYSLDTLQAAIETVIGRTSQPQNQKQITTSHAATTGDQIIGRQRRAIERFLLVFFVRHDDMSAPKDGILPLVQPSTPVQSWQRTVLRSLMLVYLLDQFKSTQPNSACLFQKESPYKSSEAVLRSLTALLIPSVGDIVRTLGYLECRVIHVQQPLQECTFRVSNLAVDLRDGVLLTRLVEHFLFTPSNRSAWIDNTVTLRLPDGENLTSIFDDRQEDCDTLSQHLKLPCLSRVQKLFNVQIALSALSNSEGLSKDAACLVKADDIVDGHREKSISLLWALLSQYGIGLLVDEKQLQDEIASFNMSDEDEITETASDHIPALLKSWASAVNARNGTTITNLTTSFADGRALTAIIDAYAAYIPSSNATLSSSTTRTSLVDRMKSLGCSSAFTALFASSTSHVPSRTTTISLLTFLASRLLPLSRCHRAASTVQRVYRLRLARRTISQRVTLARLARECAAVVERKQKVLSAATTLQRA